jgi:UDP-N-acetylmuramoyl-L-alanyl-D-glutamate--2,6-diaminopimelate ligase
MNMPAEQLKPSMTIATLLRGFAEAPDISISDIASDTRDVREGSLFIACRGERSHGLDYAAQAIESGAAAIAYDASTARKVPDIDAPLIPVGRLRSRLGEIANRFYDYPSRSVSVLAVTGTNGKTTVAWLLAQCLQRLGVPCGYAGTLGYGMDDVGGGDGMTTPDVVELHRRLAMFRDAGAACAAIEVSSHALAQDRIDGVAIHAALFTNLTRDHLDYHGDMQAYGEAKASLFLSAEPARKIVDVDSDFGRELADRCGQDVIRVSMDAARVAGVSPHVVLRATAATAHGFEVSLASSWGEGRLSLPLHGEFNVANAALVLAFLLSDDVPLDAASVALAAVNAPPGRLQRVDVDAGPEVFVDYAHTPAAVESALGALRLHCDGELWCVFGCGGDRDQGKRPLMARVVERLADRVVVTNDNPRSEDPRHIIDAILKGFEEPAAATVIEDRGAAIAWAVRNASAGDVVLLAGKGHENYQLIGDKRRDFSDYGVAAACLAARKGRAEDGE